MLGLEIWLRESLFEIPNSDPFLFPRGGLFLEASAPSYSLVSSILIGSSSVSISKSSSPSSSFSCFSDSVPCRKGVVLGFIGRGKGIGGGFLSVSLSIKGNDGLVGDQDGFLGRNGEAVEKEKGSEEVFDGKVEEEGRLRGAGAGAMNTSKHLWSGAVAAMVSRFDFCS